MNKVRRDVVLNELRQRHWRMALTVLFLPPGYTIRRIDQRLERLVARSTDPDGFDREALSDTNTMWGTR